MTAPIARRGRVFPAPQAPAAADGLVERDRPLFSGLAWTPSYAAFLVYIFNIVTYRLPVGTGTIAMSAALLLLPLEHNPLRLPRVVGWSVALLAWALLGWTTTAYPELVWDHIVEFAKIVGVVLVAVNVLTTRARLRFFLLFFLGAFALYPVRGALVTYIAYGGGPDGRAGWNYSYENPNDLAGMCLLVFSLAIGMLVTDRRLWIRACALAGALLLPLVILLTQSRGAFIAMLALAAFALKSYWRRGKMLLWAVVATVAVVFATPDSVWMRLRTLQDVTNEQTAAHAGDASSARQRLEIWKVASTVFAENPVTGVGLGAYPKVHYTTAQRAVFDPIAHGARDPHSTYLSLLAETGLPGLLLFLALIGTTVVEAERTRRLAKATQPGAALQLFYMELGLLGFLVAGIWGSYNQIVLTYLHLALIYVASQVLKTEASRGAAPLVRGRKLQITPAMAQGTIRRRRR